MKLKDWLQLRKIRPAHFARIIGAHASAVCRLRDEERDPSFAMVRRIDKATAGQVGLWDWPEPKERGR